MEYNCKIWNEKNAAGEDVYIVQFPDMPNIVTCGFSHDEALAMAKEALDGCLESDVAYGNEIPAPSFKDGWPVTVANNIVVALQLRELRGEQSQSDIARKLGLSYQAYQRLENPQKANPTIKTLERIANVFGKELTVQIG
jgi:antitoxin HicB